MAVPACASPARDQATSRCTGCGVELPLDSLTPVGDGTLHVCIRCYPIAIATLQTPQPQRAA